MKKIILALIVLLIPVVYAFTGSSANYEVTGNIGLGAVEEHASGNYKVKGVMVTQPVGEFESANYKAYSGPYYLIYVPIDMFELGLYSGWNLISLPLQPGNASVENVIKNLSGEIIVWHYNSSSDAWGVYDTEAQYPRTLYNMDYGNAYWLKSALDQTFTVYGNKVKDYTISLEVGWNFVGYNMSIGVMPDPIDDLTTPILVWAYYTEEDEWRVYDTSAPFPWMNTLKNMTQGMGYWLKSSVDQDWKI